MTGLATDASRGILVSGTFGQGGSSLDFAGASFANTRATDAKAFVIKLGP